MVTKTVGPLRLARVAARMALAVPIGVTSALAIALNTAVLATTFTAFSPLFTLCLTGGGAEVSRSGGGDDAGHFRDGMK